jgi:hypothetical protein
MHCQLDSLLASLLQLLLLSQLELLLQLQLL